MLITYLNLVNKWLLYYSNLYFVHFFAELFIKLNHRDMTFKPEEIKTKCKMDLFSHLIMSVKSYPDVAQNRKEKTKLLSFQILKVTL